jgi:hypothetical protein
MSSTETTSPTLGKLAMALAKAQGAFKALKRDAKAEIIMKSGGKYGYSYATLAACFEACREALSTNEIAITQVLNTKEGELVLTTRMIHSSGEFISSDVLIPIDSEAKNFIQGVGSSITYIRRYTYCSLVGIVADEDDDGQAGGGQANMRQPAQKRAAPPPQQQKAAAPDPLESLRKRLFAVGNEHGYSPDDIKAVVHEKYGKNVSRRDLTKEQIDELLEVIQKNPFVKPPTTDELSQPVPTEEFEPLPFEKENQ